jgi:MFS family permease
VLASRAKRLAATLYVYSFLDDLVLLYPVYAVLFTDAGLSVPEVSSLYVIWSATGIVLEVPSGVWADAVSRRLLLAGAPLLTAVGFALWVFVGTYWAFAAGFVLWGAQGALQSGSMEALVYEELERLDAGGRYVKVMGRARTAGFCGVMLAIAAAGPVFAVGGYLAVGVASVVTCVLTAAAGLAFTEHRESAPEAVDESPGYESPGYVATLRAGLAEARGARSVRRLLLMVPALAAIWGGLEEYDSLLAVDTGVGVENVPWLMLLLWVGVTVGGLLASAGKRLSTKMFSGILMVAAVALAAGALSGRAAGFVLIAVAFCAFQMASVVVDARLQETITGPSRATVTSLAGLGTDVATVLVYGAYAAGSALSLANSTIFALFAVPYAVIAIWLARGTR